MASPQHAPCMCVCISVRVSTHISVCVSVFPAADGGGGGGSSFSAIQRRANLREYPSELGCLLEVISDSSN